MNAQEDCSSPGRAAECDPPAPGGPGSGYFAKLDPLYDTSLLGVCHAAAGAPSARPRKMVGLGPDSDRSDAHRRAALIGGWELGSNDLNRPIALSRATVFNLLLEAATVQPDAAELKYRCRLGFVFLFRRGMGLGGGVEGFHTAIPVCAFCIGTNYRLLFSPRPSPTHTYRHHVFQVAGLWASFGAFSIYLN